MSDRTRIADVLRIQAMWCAKLGSSLYAALLEESARDVDDNGPIADLLARHAGDPPDAFLPLRFMGAVHRLVLAGDAPALAAYYPSVGGVPDAARAFPVFRELAVSARGKLDTLVQAPIQTNEVGRSAALIGGFLTIARETGVPLRLLEVGASAGLNLRWDKYRYESSTQSWGDATSALVLRDTFEGDPPFDVAAEVIERRGCDRDPLDPMSESGRLTLMAYLWPDQLERLASLRRALQIASEVPVTVERAAATDWIAKRLTDPVPGVATVVFHSIFIQYLAPEERQRLAATIRAAGDAAASSAPVAWLSMEPGGDEAQVRLTVWPGGETRVVATVGFHGRPVRWLGG